MPKKQSAVRVRKPQLKVRDLKPTKDAKGGSENYVKHGTKGK